MASTVADLQVGLAPRAPRTPRARSYVLCPPTHFDVTYAINPWMDPGSPVDVDLAAAQWDTLRRTYLALGHAVEVMTAGRDLPDMVFAANGGLVIGCDALLARFAHPERAGEAELHRTRMVGSGLGVTHSTHVNEGEGDFLVAGRLILAGTGFRTSREAHVQAQALFQRPVVSLELVDPRFYHLDTCLGVLDDETIAWYPPAFSSASRAELELLFPDAVVADEADALALGLNFVSDGRHVVIAERATGLRQRLAERGYEVIPVDLSELVKAGGNVKCCTMEVHP